MKALVTGATGFVGSHLVRALLSRGDSVRILARSADRAAPLVALGAEVVVGDLAEPCAVAGVTEGSETVFHLVSAMSAPDAVFEQVDVQGTQALLREAERTGVRRFVYPGTLSGYAVLDQPDGAVLDERCPFDSTGRLGNYARAKGRGEQAVLDAGRRGRLEGVIVRLGLTCGVGASVFPVHVCRMVGSRRAVVFGDGRLPLPLVYIDNAVDALLLAADTPGLDGQAFNIVDDDVLTQQDYLDLYQSTTRRSLQVLKVPRVAYLALGAVTELVAAIRGKEPATTRYRVRQRLRNVRWDCRKAHRDLQWRSRVPLREGLARSFAASVERSSNG